MIPEPSNAAGEKAQPLVIYYANTDWYLFNFRTSLAKAAISSGYRILLLSPQGEYAHRLTAMGFDWRPVPMKRRGLNPFSEMLTILSLWRIFRREQPFLVHNFTIKCAIYGSLAARLAGIRSRVNAIAGMGYVFVSGDRLARFLRPLVVALLRYSIGGRHSTIVLQNTDDAEECKRIGLRGGRLVVIPGSGVDCEKFRKKLLAESPSPMIVLLAARLLWDKGIAEYFAAARALVAEERDIKFLLAGSPDPGNPASITESLVLEWASESEAFEWLGHVDSMTHLYSRVDVFVLPSYREGLPKSLIEAAACGLALIATDVPGCRHVVEHEVNGLLIPPRDAQSLRSAIASLQDTPGLARRLGEAARLRAESEFAEPLILTETIGIYRQAAAEIDPQVSP